MYRLCTDENSARKFFTVSVYFKRCKRAEYFAHAYVFSALSEYFRGNFVARKSAGKIFINKFFDS